MRHILTLFAFLIFTLPTVAQKTIVDGNSLDDQCRYARQIENLHLGSEELGKAMFCIGYIRAVLDEIWAQQNTPEEIGVKNIGGATTCIGDSISIKQAAKVTTKYIEDNPARLQLPANLLIREAMEKAFPCK